MMILHIKSFYCRDAFLTTVQYLMTKDTEEFSQFTDSVASREYTLPRDEDTSEQKGWIRGNTKIGPVLEVTTSCLQGKYGVEIRIKSANKDNSHSWVRISHGLNKLVTNLNNNEQETSEMPFEEYALKLDAGDFASRTKAKAKPQKRDSASSSTRTILIGERTWTDVEPVENDTPYSPHISSCTVRTCLQTFTHDNSALAQVESDRKQSLTHSIINLSHMVAERRCDESDANVLELAAPSQLVSHLSDVNEIITDLINKLQSEALPEANHKQDRDNELDLETQVETHSFKSEATVLPSSEADFCVNSGITLADHTAAQLSTERVQPRIVEHAQSLDPVKDVLVIQKQVPVQRMVETPQLQFIDNVVDVPVVAQRQIPIDQIVQKTVEIPQLDVVGKIVETPKTQTFQGTQTFVSLNTAEQTLDVPVPEMVELPPIVSQDRIQQRTLTHQFRRLWRNWLRPPRFSLKTGFNSVLENRLSNPPCYFTRRESRRGM